MAKKSLKSHVEALRRELADNRSLDDDTRELLAGVADDIDEALAESAPDYESLRERVEAAAYKFEAEHPRFSGIMGDIMDTLAKLGI